MGIFWDGDDKHTEVVVFVMQAVFDEKERRYPCPGPPCFWKGLVSEMRHGERQIIMSH